jgi:hypothetical protein
MQIIDKTPIAAPLSRHFCWSILLLMKVGKKKHTSNATQLNFFSGSGSLLRFEAPSKQNFEESKTF